MRLSAPMTVDSRLCSRLHPGTSSSLPAWYARMWSCAREGLWVPASLKAYARTTHSVHVRMVYGECIATRTNRTLCMKTKTLV